MNQMTLDRPLMRLSPHDHFTESDACMNAVIFGGTGSGKTSGSGKMFRQALLRSGAGGIVACIKPDEPDLWRREARENGRANSIIELGGDNGGSINFMNWLLAQSGTDGIANVADCIMVIAEAARSAGGSGAHSGDKFWEDAPKQLVRKCLAPIYAAEGTVSVPSLMRFIQSAPSKPDQLTDAEWQSKSYWFAIMAKARQNPAVRMSDEEFSAVGRYFRDEWAVLDQKTRGNIAISLSTVLDRFSTSRLARTFCGETNIVPEMTFHGAIILMNMPTLTHHEDGVIGQQLMKYLWQRAVLTRNALAPQHRERLVFCYADEAQAVCSSGDADFLATSRSSRASTIYLTQSLPSFYAKIGGENARARADMLLANFQTKIFHNSSDPVTNQWAAEIIGKSLQLRRNSSQGESYGENFGMSMGEGTTWGTSSSVGWSKDGKGNESSSFSYGTNSGGSENNGRSRGHNSGYTSSAGVSEQMDFEIEPGFFTRHLKTGGPANGSEVSALWFQAGKVFNATHRPYIYTRFQQ